MNTNIHKIDLEEFATYTREEIEQQIIDCQNAQRKQLAKKWETMKKHDEDFIIGTKEQHIVAIEKEYYNYLNRENILHTVIELIDETGRSY